MRDSLKKALPYLPLHRTKTKRGQKLTLDDLLDQGRKSDRMDGGTLDFILMTYRCAHLFDMYLPSFAKNPVKPIEMADLWAMGFSALLTRDRTPTPLLVNELVEVSKEKFGEHTGAVTNAFLRGVTRNKEQILEDARPQILLGEELAIRWGDVPGLLEKASRGLMSRPEPGIGAFNERGEWARHAIEDFATTPKLQAADAGSWRVVEWLYTRWKSELVPGRSVLDACAAPGGKLLGLHSLCYRGEAGAKGPSFFATESKFPRLERLRENLKRWGLGALRSSLHAWGEGKANPDGFPDTFDFIVADLPCSGTGTLASRPDLLLEDLGDRIHDLAPLQAAILDDLMTRVKPGGELAVVLCSVDPEELALVTEVLGVEPSFSTWDELEVEAGTAGPLSEGASPTVIGEGASPRVTGEGASPRGPFGSNPVQGITTWIYTPPTDHDAPTEDA